MEERFDYREESNFARESFRLYLALYSLLSIMRTNIVFRIYIAVATTVGLVWSLISFGILFSSLLNRAIITNEEYLSERWGFEYQCTPELLKVATGSTMKEKTQDECIKNEKERAIMARWYSLKQDMISGSVWWILSILIFIPHFLFIYRSRVEEDHKTNKKEV